MAKIFVCLAVSTRRWSAKSTWRHEIVPQEADDTVATMVMGCAYLLEGLIVQFEIDKGRTNAVLLPFRYDNVV